MPEVKELRPDDPGWIADYRVEGRLGKGDHGVVYLATGPYGEAVAIRQLDDYQAGDRARQAFADKVAAARLVAPLCTAQILDVHLKEPGPYIVSEYIEGPSLREHLDRNGPMSSIELQRLALGTIVALAAIHHAGVVHRGLKPANVVLAEDGPRLVDFGTPREVPLRAARHRQGSASPATVPRRPFRPGSDGRVHDLLAWGSVIVFAATGGTSFVPGPARSAKDSAAGRPELGGIPAELADPLRRVLSGDPALRPSAQQTLALLLGRPAAAVDLSDPTPVLAEAAWLVRAAHLPPVGEFHDPGRPDHRERASAARRTGRRSP